MTRPGKKSVYPDCECPDKSANNLTTERINQIRDVKRFLVALIAE